MAQFLEGSITTYLEDLQGTRCRLQRLRDLKFLSGWVRSAGAHQITVEVKGSPETADGEAFNLEATTGVFNVAYPCTLLRAEGAVLRLSITGEPLVTTPGQEPRYRANEIDVIFQGPTGPLQTESIDISPSGIGLRTLEPVARFAPVRLVVRNASNSVDCCGAVRYCRPDQDSKGTYRVGIQVEFADRLSRAMWMRIVQTASQTV